MTLKVVVRNTFLDIVESDDKEVTGHRSSSVPRTWKPRSPTTFGPAVANAGSPSNASTSASDGETSEEGSAATARSPRDSPPTCYAEGMAFAPEWFSPYTGFHMIPMSPLGEMPMSPMMPMTPMAAWTPFPTVDGADLGDAADHHPALMSPVDGSCMHFMSFPCSPMPMLPGTTAMGPFDSLPVPPQLPTPSRLNPDARAFEPGALVFAPAEAGDEEGGCTTNEVGEDGGTGSDLLEADTDSNGAVTVVTSAAEEQPGAEAPSVVDGDGAA